MSKDKDPNDGLEVFTTGGRGAPNVGKHPPPRTIAAQSRARNSFAGIVILGGILLLLSGALFVSLVWRPDHVKDLLLIIGTIAGYVAGSVSFSRKDDS
jgi:hypothetical protein